MLDVDQFFSTFGHGRGGKQPLTKTHARNLIDTRMPSKYSDKECLILKAIVDGIDTGKNWQTFDIHSATAVSSVRTERILAKAHASISTLLRVLKKLSTDNLIKIHVGEAKAGHDQYSVNLEYLRTLPVYSTERHRTQYQHEQYLKRKAEASVMSAGVQQ